MAKERKSGLRRLLRLVVLVLTGAAIFEELKKPAEERTWQGIVAGVVPYDFRVPTASRIRERLWNPEGPLVGPQVFGVGWSLNVGKIVDEWRDSRS